MWGATGPNQEIIETRCYAPPKSNEKFVKVS